MSHHIEVCLGYRRPGDEILDPGHLHHHGRLYGVLVGVAGNRKFGLSLTGDATDAAINHHVARAEVVKTVPEMVMRVLPSVLPLTGVMTATQGVSA